jgi:short-subunit dehydrogenase
VKKILIAGATSAIARAYARTAAENGDALFLVARSEPRLEETASDLKLRGAATVGTFVMDLRETNRFPELIAAAEKSMSGLDTLLVAHGTLTDQDAAQTDMSLLGREIETNFTSAAALMTLVANKFEANKAGAIGVITSVAGDRGRQKNYMYGAAKAGLIAYASGLRGRLLPAGVSVTDIRPGFVDTPMTASVPKGPLFAQADAVGRSIYKAIDKRKDVVYVPGFWRFIMMGIKSVPEPIFKRMKI